MIIKSFELGKIDLKKNNFFLLYGVNEGLKKITIEEKFKKFYFNNTYDYEESEILKKKEDFFNNILTKSFFEKEKLIIINRATDKIKDLIEEVLEKKIIDLILVLNSGMLEKKSKIRSLFEKGKETICVPFYEDNNQTLSSIISSFFRNNSIPVSQQTINLIVQRCRGDRLNLQNELDKIKSFTKNKGKIEIEDLLKLTNLAENFSVSELIDSCLAKNKKKTINILNENNYTLEDCILIIRTFLMKSKRLAKLSDEFLKTKNIDATILSSKPPIFWKEKEIVKQQLRSWSLAEVMKLICQISEVELLIKQHNNNSLFILFDFIIETASPINN